MVFKLHCPMAAEVKKNRCVESGSDHTWKVSTMSTL